MKQISKHNDIIDSRDVIARIAELEAECISWSAGWNITGCLADSVTGFVDHEDAKQSILDTLQMEADRIGEDNESAAENIEALMQEINLESDEFSVFVPELNYWYWVAKGYGMPENEDDADELRELREFAEEAEGYCPDWYYGAQLINGAYFTEYAQQLAEDIGAVSSGEGWPKSCIDWDQVAEELKMDYTPIDWDGETFYVR